MKLNAISCAALVAIHCIGSAFAAGEGWTSDFEAAKKQAAEQKKDLLIDFTGSDWCGWCIKLNDEVFKKDEFKAGVKDKFVLVEIDFPQDEKKISEATKKQNDALQEKYGIQGFPTILLTDAEGKPFAATGYEEGGPVKYVEILDGLRAKKAKRDEAFAAAAKAEGVEQAKQYVAALKAMELEDATVNGFYGDIVEKIKKADPKDESGFVKQLEMKAKLAKFEEDLNGYAEKDDPEGALKFVEKTLAEGGFEGESKQQIALTKAMILAHQKKFDDAIKAVDAAKAIAPESELGKQTDMMKQQLEEMKKNPSGADEDEHEAGEEKAPEKAPEPAKPAAEEKKPAAEEKKPAAEEKK